MLMYALRVHVVVFRESSSVFSPELLGMRLQCVEVVLAVLQYICMVVLCCFVVLSFFLSERLSIHG